MAENKAQEITPDAPTAPADDFGEFEVVATHKPVSGVTEGQIPERLAAMLATHAPKALTEADYELTLTAKDEATAKRLALYARAWGARQEPKLYITKVPNRKDMGAHVARLSVKKDEDVSVDNRPGRRSGQ
jgi:hypothetical protein